MLKKKRGAQKNTFLPKKRRQTVKSQITTHTPIPIHIPIHIPTPVLTPVPNPIPEIENKPMLAAPMRILMVIDQLNVGGTETYTLSMARELLKKGVSVVIACKKGKLLDHFLGLGCPIYEIDFVLDNYEPDHEKRTQHLDLLKSIIRSENIDLVHGHQFPSGSIALTAAEQMNVPFVFTVHGTYYDRDFLESLERNATITCVSPAIRRLLLSKGVDAKIVSNGIDDHEYHSYAPSYLQHFRNKLGLPQHASVMLYAGRLSWEKGEICEELIHTIAAMRNNGYPNLHLIIAGGGNKQKDILQLVNKKQYPLDEPFIHCVGEIMNMGVYYSLSDCVIGTGRVALEAMSCERPVIAVGSKGFLGIVKPDEYEEAWDSWFGDHDSDKKCSRALLTAHLRRMLAMEPDAKMLLVKSGKQFLNDRFHISQTAQNLTDLYLSTIQLFKKDGHGNKLIELEQSHLF
ncbi:glycosyltransferase [Paenibacillus sp. UNC451MF]|uniref:glycosyltransferase n=1 Tax=Paenibacillus sp. UNC451MF TaxID=1449063 RepID=UPI00048BC1B9|nr:glycosyltransferase [Paenibacillus sp. UNC451MF]